ncbi:MAG: 3-phosphoserine/phosphohydroxythreonine transaminase [Chitinophagaceae bacterium]|nr:MAG: 3-phosphoserine/phosphohydroxythreonine transaminase [Chitinophagaceae bacterium]
MKKHNFGAGPGILKKEVLEGAADAVLNWDGIGLSLLEMSHRSKEFGEVMEKATSLVREIYKVSDEYAVLFLQGGASLQFATVPYNLLDPEDTGAYVETGSWAKKAVKEAKGLAKVHIAGSSADKNFNYIPKKLDVPSNAKYLHITTNNTIFGTQFHHTPETNVPLIADMSSDIFCRPFDAGRFDMIYAGAQKNLGPAGTTLVIIKKSLLGKIKRYIPTMLNYQTHIDNDSLFNTPPVFAIYVSYLSLKWIKENGLEKIGKQNEKKASLLYGEIDRNSLFEGTAAKEDRSLMNVTFVLKNNALDADFLKFATDKGIVGLKGHRSVGGFRASIYNALDLSSVEYLVSLMQEFEKLNS